MKLLTEVLITVQGTTVINLTSVGSDATFTPNIFKWTYNLQETTFDSAKGAVFAGYNNQYGGEYAHLSNPQRLRYILGDNLFESISGSILEQETQLEHSQLLDGHLMVIQFMVLMDILIQRISLQILLD